MQRVTPGDRKRQYPSCSAHEDSSIEDYVRNIDWVFAKDSPMTRAVRAFPWSDTPLGPFESWPLAWKSALSIVLSSDFPMVCWLGPEYHLVYNDTYVPQIGDKHPSALGRPGREVWVEAWPAIAQSLETVYRTGATRSGVDERFLIQRHGFLEETFWTGSYSPLRDGAGRVIGVFTAAKESSARIIAERQLATFKEVATCSNAYTTASVAQGFIDGLRSNHYDVPFALLYLGAGQGHPLRLANKLRAETHSSDIPAAFASLNSRDIQVVATPAELMIAAERPTRTLCVPLVGSTKDHETAGALYGLLIMGANPHRRLDDSYLSFAKLLASTLCAALASSREHERDRQRAEELAELDRLRVTFFANVSHELRTPLTLLMGPLEEVLGEAAGLAPAHRDALSSALRNSKRLLSLVNTLLDFGRIEAGKMQATYRPTDLAAVTRGIVENFRGVCERASLVLEVECEPMHERVYVDMDAWEKIIHNLVSNAYKFTLKGGIHVSLRKDGDAVVLQVRDTGCGIAAQDLAAVFQRFYRAPSSVGRTQEGSGIGLSLVSELVRLHGGTIKAESIQGVCSVFTVRLPCGHAHLPPHQVHAEEAPALRFHSASRRSAELADALLHQPSVVHTSHLSAHSTSIGRVMLVEDNDDMRTYVSRVLTNGGYDVVLASDGQDAIDKLAALPAADLPDLVLSDIAMPRLDGRGLLLAIRNSPAPISDMPVIILSAQTSNDEPNLNIRLGADDYLVKPFSSRDLLTRVSVRIQRAVAARKERSLREEAEQSSKATERFLAMLSHELRTPLTPALMLAEAGKLDATLPATAREDFGTIAANIRLEVQLIADLLDVTRIKQGKMELLWQPHVDVHTLLRQTVLLLESKIREKALHIDLHLSLSPLSVGGDATRLQQVFWNLLGNAIKFTPHGGRIKVKTFVCGTNCQIDFADSGVGLEPAAIPRLFDAFQQGGPSVTREYGGLGLGLTIAKTLVEMHRGVIGATSGGPGKGAVFSVTLPLASQPTAALGGADSAASSAASAPTLDSSEATPSLRVLVVDDNLSTLAVLCRMLQRLGHVPQSASSVAEAIRALRTQQFDALICDWGLHDGTGRDVVSAVATDMYCITLSGYGTDEDIQRSKEAGFAQHLVKPISLAELKRVLRDAAASLTTDDGNGAQ